MKERDFKGVWIPKEIWLSKELTLREKVLLVEIDSLYKNGSCFATNKYFAEFFDISRTRISEVISSLISKGFLKAEYTKAGRRTLIHYSEKVETPHKEKLKPPSTKVETVLNNTNISTDINNVLFEEWWKTYPIKKNKKKSLLAFNNLARRNKNELQKMLDDDLQARYKDTEKKYIPLASTYINGERWNDETETTKTNTYDTKQKHLYT